MERIELPDVLSPSSPRQGIHPLALIIGVLGLLLLIVLVAASSYQREKLRYMATKLLRKKRGSFDPSKQSTFILSLPFVPPHFFLSQMMMLLPRMLRLVFPPL